MFNLYKIYNDVNDKIYIGQTNRTLKQRLQVHFNDSKVKDTYFYRAIRKYGRQHFFIELIDTASNQEELDQKEYDEILSYPREMLYNTKFSKGKQGGDTLTGNMSPEISKKISDSKLGSKNPKSKKVKAINVVNNTSYVFGSMGECARMLGFPDHTCVSKRCLGKAKYPYKNIWQFEFYVEQ